MFRRNADIYIIQSNNFVYLMVMTYLINFLVNNLVVSHKRTQHNLDYTNGVLIPID